MQHLKHDKRKLIEYLMPFFVVIALIMSTCLIAFADSNVNESSSPNISDNNEICTAKTASVKMGRAKVTFPIVFVRSGGSFSSSIVGIYLYQREVNVVGSEGSYSKIIYKNNGKQTEYAYVFTPFLSFYEAEVKAKYEFYHLAQNDKKTLSHIFEGENLSYSVSNSSVVEIINGNTEFKGKKPGTAIITAHKGYSSAVVTVYVFYRWKNNTSSEGMKNYNWTTKTNKTTAFYKGPDEGYRYDISSGKSVEVHGDIGSWAYVKVANGGTYNNGFVKIEDISTKNTESFYNSLGWKWPTQDKTIHHISSPYAPRSDSTSTSVMHRGADIVKSGGGTEGNYVVAPCNGQVRYIRANTDSCGYCISIITDDTDSTTGQKLAVIFMHLKELPKDSDGALIQVGKRVTENMIIGKIGKTNGGTNSSMGAHLHMETNNRSAGVGDSGRNNFDYTINPLLYYLDMKESITYNYGASMTNIGTYGFYWYYYQQN